MSNARVDVKIKTDYVENTSYKTDYPSLRQADRIADHIDSTLNAMDELWLDDWTDVEKTEFGTVLIHTQDDDGTQHVFEVSTNELEVTVDELDPEDEPETVDPDRKRDIEQDR